MGSCWRSAACGVTPAVFVWNVRRGDLTSVLQGHTGYVVAARFAHSGYLLATSSWDGTTRLWDGASGEPLAMARVSATDSSPDDRRLAFAWVGRSASGTSTWPRSVGHSIPACSATAPRRDEHRGRSSADVSPDGRLLATCDGDGVQLWEADTGRELAHLKSGDRDRALPPRRRKLVTAAGGAWYRWPIRPDPDVGGRVLRIGPPELLRRTRARDLAGELAPRSSNAGTD